MFGRKIFFLAAGYIAGNIVNSLYTTKRKKNINSQKEEDMKLLVDNFLNTQKNFISDLEEKYIPEQHKSMFQEKKQDFLKLARSYTKKGKEFLTAISEYSRVQEGKDTLEQGLLKAKFKGEDTLKKGKLIAKKLKK